MDAIQWKSVLLNYYKRLDIQKAIVANAQDKEVVGSYAGEGYAKRPDMLQYPRDVFEQVMHGITSFHGSEELWTNPLGIIPNMKRDDVAALRKGWDLVLDIDSPYWELSKLTAMLMVRTLEDHGIQAISIKFSGNKGFHIAVPFESFPAKVNDVETRLLFPEAARKVATYILSYIEDKLVIKNQDTITFGDVQYTQKQLEDMTGMEPDKLTYFKCKECKKRIPGNKVSRKKFKYNCPKCGYSTETFSDSYKSCPECLAIFTKEEIKVSKCTCGSDDLDGPHFNTLAIIEVDTILISSRHLYRMPYSLHEKSKLASIPISKEKIMDFDKKDAIPENVKVGDVFLDRTLGKGEAGPLFKRAYEHVFDQNLIKKESERREFVEEEDFKFPEDITPEEYFPPCINNILKGVKDGKKRSLFMVVNYLTSLGWSYEKIKELLENWNEKNPEPLRDTLIVGQLRYHKANKKKVLPPNCDNDMYYTGIMVCEPDNLCQRIKNPVQYSKRKIYFKRAKAPRGKKASPSAPKKKSASS